MASGTRWRIAEEVKILNRRFRSFKLPLRRLLAAMLFSAILAACSGSAERIDSEGSRSGSEIVVASGGGQEITPTIPRAQSVAALQAPLLGAANIRFQKISLEQGLSQSSVQAILQDHIGFMWFGTLDGLNRYDGYEIEVYKHDPEDPSSLSDNIIRAIYEDSQGIIWIGTSAGGLNRYDPVSDTFAGFRHDPADDNSLSSDAVLSIIEDSRGELWIGTNGGGLNQLDRSSGRFTRYQNVPNDLTSLSNNTVESIIEDSAGDIWLATNGGGLNRFDRDSGRFTSYQNEADNPRSLANNYVHSIFEDESGFLWVGTRDGVLHKFNPTTGVFYRYLSGSIDPDSLIDYAVTDIAAYDSDRLWVSTNGGGIKLFDKQSGQFNHYLNDLSNPNSLSSNSARTLYKDNSGVLWIGTDGGGVNKFSNSSMRFLHVQNDPNNPYSLSSNDVLAIFEDQSGDLWVGTLGGGLNRFEQELGRLTRYTHETQELDSISSNIVYAIIQDRSGIMWIGTSSGLDMLLPETETFKHYQNEPGIINSLSHNVVLSLFEDQNGYIWIGTSGGLNRFDPAAERFTRYLNEPQDPRSISKGSVRAIHGDQDGFLWIATDNGLDRLEPNGRTFGHFRSDPNRLNSLSDNRVLTIHEDSQGVMWIGTYGGGLNKFDPEIGFLANYREKDGLINDTVMGILEDEAGYLWISTIQGLSRFDPGDETFRNYDVRDGLQSNEFNANAFYKGSNGKMYFGGINGFNAFYPESITDNPHIPSIVLTSLTQGGESLPIDVSADGQNEVILSWPNDFFEFEVTALSYSQPEKNQYAYMLDGYDQEWTDLGTRRVGRYANLPAGNYTLRLRGSNNDGVWNEQGISLNITIIPPFWETWWFRALIVLGIVGGIVGGYRIRVRSIEARNRELAELVNERTSDLALRTQELERRKNAAEGLREILVILNSNRSLEESLDYIVNQVAALTDADNVIIFGQEDTKTAIIASSMRRQDSDMEALPAFVTQPLLRGQTIIQDGNYSAASEVMVLEQVPFDYQSMLGIPLAVGGESYGGLILFSENSRSFSDEELELSSTFADQAMLAIANARLRDQAEENAAAMERSRLARDLHDAVTQTLFSASLIAEVLPPTWEANQDEGRHLLSELRQLSRGALAEMRTLLLELRPAALADAGLEDLLNQLADSLTGRTGIPVDLSIKGPCALPPDLHVTIYRIVQEALNNIAKHANASHVSVILACGGSNGSKTLANNLRLVISDDGSGFDSNCVAPDCLGLAIMRERAQAVGAELDIESVKGLGTTISLRWENRMEMATPDSNTIPAQQ